MASDILIYQAELVPVGADQKQHIELARDLAIRFNTQYSNTFVIPEPYISDAGARIMSLQDPEMKMSKSDKNLNNIISLLDDPGQIRKKIKRAVTDSGSEIRYAKSSPGLSNLISMYSLISNISIEAVEKSFEGKMYSDFKNELGNEMVDYLDPIQKKYSEIIEDKEYLSSVLNKGAEEAFTRARKTLSKVYRKVGFVSKQFK